MSNLVQVDFTKIEGVLIHGDLSKLSTPEKVNYYNKVCTSLGLNPLTKPFDYIKLNGKEVLYAKRDATDQLRRIYSVSIIAITKETANDIIMVTARAQDKSGRQDEAMGAVSIKGLSGEQLANALMKAETKAKRRVTLSICGLGLLDETEVEDLEIQVEREVTAKKLTESVKATSEAPAFEAADYFEPLDLEPEAEPESEGSSLAEYTVQVGQKLFGKKLKDVSPSNLKSYLTWIRAIQRPSPSLVECGDKIEAYLKEIE